MEKDFSNIGNQNYQSSLFNRQQWVQPPQGPDQDSDINISSHSKGFISKIYLPLEDSPSSSENSTLEEELSNQPIQSQAESQTTFPRISNSIEMTEEVSNNEGSSNNDSSQRTMAEEPIFAIRSTRRKDNNNNAHKALITLLNEALKDIGLLAGLKKALKKEKITFQKGSRYAFIIRLIDILRIYPSQKELVFQAFTKRLSQDLTLIEGNPESELLWELKDIYEEATMLFFEKKIIEATERIYTVRNNKERKYKENGIQRVRDYLAMTRFV